MLKNNIIKNKYYRGVTLIELLVVISIFIILSTITIFNYGKFRSFLSIQNLSDDIALSIRKAQSSAIGVIGSGGSFDYGYGIQFTIRPDKEKDFSGSKKTFVLFIDKNNDRQYNEEVEFLEALNITSADSISGISYNLAGSSHDLDENDYMEILFKRPTPEPKFCLKRNHFDSPCHSKSSLISEIQIKISTNNDSSINKIIHISNNGQISTSS